MAYKEEDYLQLSGLQHFRFCRRRWALIHVENLWQENLHTTEGALFHDRAHNGDLREKRGDRLTVRDLRLHSASLGISGASDVVEFIRSPNGVPLAGEEGLWLPYPVEYKKGEPRSDSGDHWQLCAQAMCLEEMLCCQIPEGALYYGEPRRRIPVAFTQSLRQEVKDALQEMHQYAARGYTPRVKPGKHCNACSLKELCVPKLMRIQSASAYLQKHLEDKP